LSLGLLLSRTQDVMRTPAAVIAAPKHFESQKCESGRKNFLWLATACHRKAQPGELSGSSLRVTRVMPVNALWKQTFATALAPARESGAATLCAHACAKTVLAFSRSFGWLVSAFHRQ
jgi:hypothetical protein